MDALRKARAWNARHERQGRVRGASTITMQCARNVFLWQGRTYVRKALELWFTELMEVTWSKRRILEVYVNVIEWGPGVYGAQAAAERYFRVPAARLDARQAALLAAALPDPLDAQPRRSHARSSTRARPASRGAPRWCACAAWSGRRRSGGWRRAAALAGEPGAGGDDERRAAALSHLDVALDDHATAEPDVPADDEAPCPHERRRSLREARPQVVAPAGSASDRDRPRGRPHAAAATATMR